MNIGERIKYYRKKSGITQQKLAELIGVQASAISKYEKNIVSPTWKCLNEICDALDTNITDFFVDLLIPNSNDNSNSQSFSATFFTEEGEKYLLKQDTISKYDILNTFGQQKANEYITDLSEQEKYTKPDNED